eukprot:scaffold308102_cov30-Tisochrysis_lutea.AAC.2
MQQGGDCLRGGHVVHKGAPSLGPRFADIVAVVDEYGALSRVAVLLSTHTAHHLKGCSQLASTPCRLLPPRALPQCAEREAGQQAELVYACIRVGEEGPQVPAALGPIELLEKLRVGVDGRPKFGVSYCGRVTTTQQMACTPVKVGKHAVKITIDAPPAE